MRNRSLARQFLHLVIALILGNACPGGVLAQNGHSHETTPQTQQLTSAQGELLKIVRESTAKYKYVSAAEADGYALLFGCVS